MRGRLCHHERAEAVDEATDERRRPPFREPPRHEEEGHGRCGEAERDQDVEGRDRPEEERDRCSEDAEQRHRGVVHQVQPDGHVEPCVLERVDAVNDVPGRLRQEPHLLRRVVAARRLQGVGEPVDPDTAVGQEGEQHVHGEAEHGAAPAGPARTLLPGTYVPAADGGGPPAGAIHSSRARSGQDAGVAAAPRGTCSAPRCGDRRRRPTCGSGGNMAQDTTSRTPRPRGGRPWRDRSGRPRRAGCVASSPEPRPGGRVPTGGSAPRPAGAACPDPPGGRPRPGAPRAGAIGFAPIPGGSQRPRGGGSECCMLNDQVRTITTSR